MPEPIQLLNLTQFRLLLPDEHVLSRKIAQVHVHHTWKPARADFRGRDTVEAIRNYHIGLGWIDIAQHLTIDPQGGLWTGRNWNLPPASSKGHNGTADIGPFMIEIVGNFDKGHDRFDGAQRDATVEVVAHVLRVYGLTVDAIRFHRELNNNLKTCPGSGIDRKTFDAHVGKVLDKKRPAPAPLFAREFLRGVDVTWPVTSTSRDATRDVTVPEHDAAAIAIEQRTRSSVAAAQRTIRYSADMSRLIEPPRARGEDWTMLKPHVVNLSKGALSEGGEFSTSPADLDRIIDAIADHAAENPQLPILLYAHGGLVEETGALGYAKRMFNWWLGKGVYPVFFIWESGLLEILRQYIVGPRDVWDFTTDPAIEIAAKPAGTLAWSGMKDSARRASAADLGEGAPGGAYLFGEKLARFMTANPGLTVHTVGHSAGAIFHAHLVPMLRGHGLANVASLSLLAPACRTELFTQSLLPLVSNGYIQRHHMFTMEDEAERQDDCFRVYHKSLLYLVSHSFEGLARQPILGLDRSMRKDATLAALYGLGGSPAAPNVEVQFSLARDKEENPLTRSVTHGGFDNDHKTISSVIRRILGIADDTGFGEADFPYPPQPRSFDPAEAVPPMPSRAVLRAQNRPTTLPIPAGRRLALCIGIDRYRDRPLAGCVNDARAWGQALTGLGFDVRYLLDEQATNQAIMDGLRGLISGAQAGDVLVMQYSGHGTQLPDDNGDEPFDQAFVPVDYHTGALFLRDDVVGAALTELPTGAGLTLFMDCCHSGTISRFAPAMRAQESDTERVRFMPLTPDLVGAHRAYRRSRGRGAAAPVASAPGVIHFAACRDQEYAWETDGRGDFTVAATAVLASAMTRGDSNEAFIDGVARDVGTRNRQHPGMMSTATGMSGRRLLAPLTADALSSGAPAVSSGALDAELVTRLESIVELLKQRVVR